MDDEKSSLSLGGTASDDEPSVIPSQLHPFRAYPLSQFTPGEQQLSKERQGCDYLVLYFVVKKDAHSYHNMI